MNYDKLMEEQMSSTKEGSTLLLHACCAPCSSACLERLSNFFKITIIYYNPNITEEKEYLKRLEELKNFIQKIKVKYPINIIDTRYNPKEFFEISKGLEKEKERGKRCYKCYEIGENLSNKYQTSYLYSDFKKKNGYKRSIELSKEYNLYRQDYCGCIYSKLEREEEKNKQIRLT